MEFNEYLHNLIEKGIFTKKEAAYSTGTDLINSPVIMDKPAVYPPIDNSYNPDNKKDLSKSKKLNKDYIKEMYNSGKSIQNIAKFYGCGSKTIQAILNESNIDIRSECYSGLTGKYRNPIKQNPELINKIIEDYNSGFTVGDISKKYKIDDTTVEYWLKKLDKYVSGRDVNKGRLLVPQELLNAWKDIYLSGMRIYDISKRYPEYSQAQISHQLHRNFPDMEFRHQKSKIKEDKNIPGVEEIQPTELDLIDDDPLVYSEAAGGYVSKNYTGKRYSKPKIKEEYIPPPAPIDPDELLPEKELYPLQDSNIEEINGVPVDSDKYLPERLPDDRLNYTDFDNAEGVTSKEEYIPPPPPDLSINFKIKSNRAIQTEIIKKLLKRYKKFSGEPDMQEFNSVLQKLLFSELPKPSSAWDNWGATMYRFNIPYLRPVVGTGYVIIGEYDLDKTN